MSTVPTSSRPTSSRSPVKTVSVALGTLALAALLAACGKTEPERAPTPVAAPAPAVVPAQGAETTVRTDIDDSVVTARVKSALAIDDVVKGMDISVETRKGEVVLSGFVDSKVQMERAGTLAQSAEGVDQVRNDLLVRQ